jgi:adenosine kinase
VSSNYQAIQDSFTYANENQKLFAFNLSGEFWIETYKDKFINIIPYCDFLFGNTNEFTSLAGILNIEFESPEDLVEKLSK